MAQRIFIHHIHRGTTRAEDAEGTPTQSHISPSILVYQDNIPEPRPTPNLVTKKTRTPRRKTSLVEPTPLSPVREASSNPLNLKRSTVSGCTKSCQDAPKVDGAGQLQKLTALVNLVNPLRVHTASERRGINLKQFKDFHLEAKATKVLKTFTWKPRPEYGLDCLICAIFARQRTYKAVNL